MLIYMLQDEDNLNLKEKLRTKVKSDLSELESTCCDMASVLRALGIQVNDGANEVSEHVFTVHGYPDINFNTKVNEKQVSSFRV